MTRTLAHRLILAATALTAAACQQLPTLDQKPAPASPQITESVLRGRATEQLAAGVKQYEVGEYDNAVKSLSGSLEHGMLSKAEQARARKYLAFTHCVSQRELQCRDEFRKAFEIYSDFSLTSAEDGHPIWGPIYRNVRTQLIAEREAQQGKPFIPLARAEQILADGIVKYDSGDYAAANTLLEAALREGLKAKEDQVRAMKHVAFTLCLQSKFAPCRAEFVKIFAVDPAFDLTPAEAGHPSWTQTFARAKAQAKKDLAAQEAKGKSAREKAAAPPTAGVPRKN
ncbi:MAG: TssQ family T6SS-associated lipoprotein [Usitatibacter sp.]